MSETRVVTMGTWKMPFRDRVRCALLILLGRRIRFTAAIVEETP